MMLSAFESRLAARVARAMLPEGALDGAVDGVDAGARFSSHMAHSPWWSALAIRAVLWLVWLRPLFALRPRTFESLDDPARVALLEALASSPRYAVREGVLLLKLMLCMAVLGNGAVLAHFGAYDLAPRRHRPAGGA